MAANMQQMAGGQMMPQQMRPLQQYVFQSLVRGTPQNLPQISWQVSVPINERVVKVMQLVTNALLSHPNNPEQVRIADFCLSFERETFLKAPNKDSYDASMQSKTQEFFQKRKANEPMLQNNLNANALQAQAYGQPGMNMNGQMGRGLNPQQNFQQQIQPFQQVMQQQMSQQPQQQQQQFLQQQQQMQQQLLQRQAQQQQQAQRAQQNQQQPQQNQQQMGMGMGMGMNLGNMSIQQAGRGMTPQQQQQMMAMANNMNRAGAGLNDISKLAAADRQKVLDLGQKLYDTATEESKTNARMTIQQKMPKHQWDEWQAAGKDPALYVYQQHAFTVLKANIAKLQQRQQLQQQQPGQQQNSQAQNQNGPQSAMMQQQQSQQSIQQRQNAMNNAQQQGGANDFNFNPNMDSIKDQQMNGLMAQQAGQIVVPASGPNRSSGSHPMSANGSNQQNANQNQTPRMQQQPSQGQGQGMSINAQQMKIGQTNQQKMQGQQGQMPNPMGTSQSPGMGTLNAPTRPQSGMSQMGGQGMNQSNNSFGDQRFNQGTQRPNNQAFQAMMSQMPAEQQRQLTSMPPDKLQDTIRRWQMQRQAAMGSATPDGNQTQMQNRPASQMGPMGQMPQNMNAQGMQGMQGMQQPGVSNPAQNRMNPQAQNFMDNMEVPPGVTQQIPNVPAEVKRWKELKSWAAQNNLPQNMRQQLMAFQHRHFQMFMQQRRAAAQNGQNGQAAPGQMNQGAQGLGAPMPNTQHGQMQQQQPKSQQQNQTPQSGAGPFPAGIDQVSVQELNSIRQQKPGLSNIADEQLRSMIIQMKRQNFINQQKMRAAQAQLQQNQGQGQGAQNAMNPALIAQQARLQQQAQQAQQNNQGGQNQGQRGPVPTPQNNNLQVPEPKSQATLNQNVNNRPNAKAPTPSPAQQAKNLKRPSTDDATDMTGGQKAGAQAPNATPKPGVQQQQSAMHGNLKQMQTLLRMSSQELAKLPADQRAKVEQFRKMQMAAAGKGPPLNTGQGAVTNENSTRLRSLGQEAQAQVNQQQMPDIPMSPEEYRETAKWLKRIVVDMSKIGRGLIRWYGLTRDDERAKEFFKIRMRIVRQHADGEGMQVLKDKFSMRISDLEEARGVLEQMAKDLAGSLLQARKPQGVPGTTPNAAPAMQQQNSQQQQEVQTTPPVSQQQAPLNAMNLEKNSQAHKPQKGVGKGSKPPTAPTVSQPPHPFGAASPHGNPTYVNKPKDMNLQLPPSRKKQKLSGQEANQGQTTGAGQFPAQDAKHQEPPKPVLTCKEPECEESIKGFPDQQALDKHIQEEHIKPGENPVQFVQDNLVLALGLESDGTLRKDQKSAPAMSATASKQGQTGGEQASTAHPDHQGAAETADSWAGSTIDPQALLTNLGLENGIPGVISDINAYRAMTPKDTPESSKDSGSSEPNSDISDGVSLEIGFDFQRFDDDLLFNMSNAKLEELGSADDMNGYALDPSVLLDAPEEMIPDWDDVKIDFDKPFQLDTSLYSMTTV